MQTFINILIPAMLIVIDNIDNLHCAPKTCLIRCPMDKILKYPAQKYNILNSLK